MSLIDKLVAAVTPPESAHDRAEARTKARALAQGDDWLSRIIDHHEGIEAAFAAVKDAGQATSRNEKLKELGLLLTGHAQAEEIAIYPELAQNGANGHATTGYEEQAVVKIQMSELEKLDPMSQDFLDKLGHIESAVAHHVYAEEHHWFVELKDKIAAADQLALTRRYVEEYERYVGPDAASERAHMGFAVPN